MPLMILIPENVEEALKIFAGESKRKPEEIAISLLTRGFLAEIILIHKTAVKKNKFVEEATDLKNSIFELLVTTDRSFH